jgi:hypothetical protein
MSKRKRQPPQDDRVPPRPPRGTRVGNIIAKRGKTLNPDPPLPDPPASASSAQDPPPRPPPPPRLSNPPLIGSTQRGAPYFRQIPTRSQSKGGVHQYDAAEVTNVIVNRLKINPILRVRNAATGRIDLVDNPNNKYVIENVIDTANQARLHAPNTIANLRNDKVVIVIFNYQGPAHWTGAVLKKLGNNDYTAYYNDPLGNAYTAAGSQNGHADVFFREVEKGLPTLRVVDFHLQQQTDGTSCGPLTVENMIELARAPEGRTDAQLRTLLTKFSDLSYLELRNAQAAQMASIQEEQKYDNDNKNESRDIRAVTRRQRAEAAAEKAKKKADKRKDDNAMEDEGGDGGGGGGGGDDDPHDDGGGGGGGDDDPHDDGGGGGGGPEPNEGDINQNIDDLNAITNYLWDPQTGLEKKKLQDEREKYCKIAAQILANCRWQTAMKRDNADLVYNALRILKDEGIISSKKFVGPQGSNLTFLNEKLGEYRRKKAAKDPFFANLNRQERGKMNAYQSKFKAIRNRMQKAFDKDVARPRNRPADAQPDDEPMPDA